jgi:hypothetical protein
VTTALQFFPNRNTAKPRHISTNVNANHTDDLIVMNEYEWIVPRGKFIRTIFIVIKSTSSLEQNPCGLREESPRSGGALDQKVSPMFSLGSGPYGFEFSVKRNVRNGLGIKTDFSGYYDPFPPGPGSYCVNSGCVNGLTFKATGKAFYITSGAEWKIRRDKRFAPFAQALGGIVHSQATF